MKEKKLLDALNEIEDNFINEAKPEFKKSRNIINFKWIAVAACFTVLVCIAITLSKTIPSQFISEEETISNTEEIVTEKGEGIIVNEENITEILLEAETTEIQSETNVIEGPCVTLAPDYWKKLDINQQYGYFTINNNRYENTNKVLSDSDLGKKFTDITVTGTDLYNKKTYTKDAEIFFIKAIDYNCAVAVKFNGNSKYFVYINPDYKFRTLGELIDKLSLEDNIMISKALYNLDDQPDYSAIKYKPLPKELIFEKLLNDRMLTASYKRETVSTSNFIIYFSINPISQIYNITDCYFIIDPAGYLTVNVMTRDHHFFIGEKTANDFINYVFDNYEGKRLVPTTELPIVYNGALSDSAVTEKTTE